jgi:hypothetical protein
LLHVTNGDSAGGALIQAGFRPVLPWQDVLHEGPVRAGLSFDQLSEERARFIAEAGWGPLAEVQTTFRQRDEELRDSLSQDEVVLWFEHDLYDQLQLIQVLDWFAQHPHPRLSLVCEAEYVGNMPPARMRELFLPRKVVTAEQLRQASEAWSAFTATDPSGMNDLETTALPFLGAALRRQLEEYPWTTDGLSRLERRVLDLLERGPLPWTRVFTGIDEDPIFLGDLVLRWHLARMAEEGLLEERGGQWGLKSRRRTKRVPRWLGGVRIDEQCPWRWDAAIARLVKTAEM